MDKTKEDLQVGDELVIKSRFDHLSVHKIIRETKTMWVLEGTTTRVRKDNLQIYGSQDWDSRFVAIKGSPMAQSWILRANEKVAIRRVKALVAGLDPQLLALQREKMRDGQTGPLEEIESELGHLRDLLILTKDES